MDDTKGVPNEYSGRVYDKCTFLPRAYTKAFTSSYDFIAPRMVKLFAGR